MKKIYKYYKFKSLAKKSKSKDYCKINKTKKIYWVNINLMKIILIQTKKLIAKLKIARDYYQMILTKI